MRLIHRRPVWKLDLAMLRGYHGWGHFVIAAGIDEGNEVRHADSLVLLPLEPVHVFAHNSESVRGNIRHGRCGVVLDGQDLVLVVQG